MDRQAGKVNRGNGYEFSGGTGADTPDIALDVAVSGSNAYVADADSSLQVFDVSNPAFPWRNWALDIGYANEVEASDSYLCVIGFRASRATVMDISVPGSPVVLARVGMVDRHRPTSIAVDGSRAYVATEQGLEIIDIPSSHPAPRLATVDTPGSAMNLAVAGTLAYVADDESGLQVIDISDPSQPTVVGSEDTPFSARDVVVSGSYGYVTDLEGGVRVIDISSPRSPITVFGIDTGDLAVGITVDAPHLYVADGLDGLQVIDISDPTRPRTISSVNTPVFAYDVTIDGSHAYVADGQSGLQVIDVSDPASPVIAGGVDTPGEARAVAVAGSKAFVADARSGLQCIDVAHPTNPIIVADLELPGLANDLWLSGDCLYVGSRPEGVFIIDILDLFSPRVIGQAYVEAPHGLIAVGDLLYVTSGIFGLQVLPTQCAYQSPTLILELRATREVEGVKVSLRASEPFLLFSVLRAIGEEPPPSAFECLTSDPVRHNSDEWDYLDDTASAMVSYTYRVAARRAGGPEELSATLYVPAVVPPLLAVKLAGPNPTSQEVSLRVDLPTSGHVKLAIYDHTGRCLRRLLNGPADGGRHYVAWDRTDGRGTPVSAGVYFARVSSSTGSATTRLVLLQ